MIREVCLFDKFSFCKNGVKCMRIHLKEVCQNRECDYRRCNKRHPKPCRIFRMNGFCRFGTSCRYSHRLPKEVEEQNEKIESIEKVNVLLSKQVQDQNNEIKELKKRLIEIEGRELKSLQKQIDDLAKDNSKKETAIQKLKLVEKVGEINDETELEQSSMIEDDDDVANEIVFEPLITSKKKKWARKDESFTIAQQFDIIHTGQNYFPKEKDHFECIKEAFIYNAEILEKEAVNQKITSKELKAAIRFFKDIINRADFTKQHYKEVVDKGQDFLWTEMKKVDNDV